MKNEKVFDRRGATYLFLIGLFSMTQVRLGAKLGISEFFCCLVGPFLFFADLPKFRRDGVMVFFNLLILWIVGACISDFVNHTAFWQLMRGIAVPVVVFCNSVCIYHHLRRDPHNLKWLIFGIALSSVLSIFVFQGGSAGDMAAEGDFSGAIDAVVGYKLFWFGVVDTWLSLPIEGWYFNTPMVYQYIAMSIIAIAAVATGGRSAFAVKMVCLFFIVIGARSIQSIRRIHRMFPVIFLGVLCLAVAVKGAYSYAAKHGYLNAEETEKYYDQSSKGTGFLSLLMSGRSEFFVGLIAALDKPLLGHGSCALDERGYRDEFLSKYGTTAEINKALEDRQFRAQMGIRVGVIPAHSHVITYWMWHGIPGLLFWLYVLKLVIDTMWKRLAIIPEWFGYFAVVVPAWLWDYFFSPFGQRVTESMMFCAMLVLLKLEKQSKKRPMQSMY